MKEDPPETNLEVDFQKVSNLNKKPFQCELCKKLLVVDWVADTMKGESVCDNFLAHETRNVAGVINARFCPKPSNL